jgi:GTP-binding protein
MEPMEEVQVDVGEEFAGTIIKALQARKAIMTNLVIIGDKQRITFRAPTRALIGYYSDFLTETKGTGTMSRTFDSYDKWQGPIESRFNGVLISMENGKSAAYALFNLQDRGKMFIGATEEVYVGMVVGENAKDNDLEVNVVRGKQLTNMRASGKDDALKLVPHSGKSLEEAIAYIDEDEMIEVTPNFLRIRKKYLDPNERKKHSRKK